MNYSQMDMFSLQTETKAAAWQKLASFQFEEAMSAFSRFGKEFNSTDVETWEALECIRYWEADLR